MRITRLLAAAAVTAAALTVPPAVAAPPTPFGCTALADGATVGGDPAGLVAVGAVLVASGQVECHRDLLTTPPGQHLEPFTMDISIEIVHANGTKICSHGPLFYPSPGPADVMAIHLQCSVPVSSSLRNGPFYVGLHWATTSPYICCGYRRAWISPAGATT